MSRSSTTTTRPLRCHPAQLRIEEARARRGGASGGSKLEGKGQKQQAQQQGKKGGAGHHPQAKPPQHKGAPSVTAAQASPLGSGGAGRRPSEQALDIQFGKIAVPAQGPERLRLKKGGKNLVGLLQKAEEKERRLKELQASEEGKDQAQALLWKDALKSAHGEKVLDNPKASTTPQKRKQAPSTLAVCVCVAAVCVLVLIVDHIMITPSHTCIHVPHSC